MLGDATRAFYDGLREATRAAALAGAEAAANDLMELAAYSDADGEHLGGWSDRTEHMKESYGVLPAIETPGGGRTAVFNTADYAAHVEKTGRWVVTGLARLFGAYFQPRFRDALGRHRSTIVIRRAA